jgi:hypothetical protein
MAYTPTTYTGLYNQITSTTTVSSAAPGSTRWNTITNQFEAFDGVKWVAVTDGTVKELTLAEWIEEAQDRVGSYVDEDHKDNATIQDAYQEWVSACEKFRVIAGLAEK